MSITTFSPAIKPVAGYIDVAIGAGFLSVATPKLSELSHLVTCAIIGVTSKTNVAMKSHQDLCSKDATESLDTRTRTLETLVFKGDGAAGEAAFLALVAEDATVGMFVRPFISSIAEGGAVLTVGDKGDAFEFKVAALDRGPATVGADWTYEVSAYEVQRSALNVALIA